MEFLRRFWRVVEHDIPWAVSAFVFTQVIDPSRASLKQMTPRRLVYLAAFLLFSIAAAQMLSADLAIMLAGDSALYFEIATFAYLTLVRARVYRAVKPAMQMVRQALRRTVSRVTARTKRPQRQPRLFDQDDGGDVPDGAWAFA